MTHYEALLARFGASNLTDACEGLLDSISHRRRLGSDADLDALVQELNVEIVIADRERFEGRYSWDESGDCITLTKQQNRSRARFTLAHELGHCILKRSFEGTHAAGQRFRTNRITPSERNEEERLANAIAAELLMPRRVLIDAIRFETLSWQLVASLCKRFQVSRESAIRRLAEITAAPFAYLAIIPRIFADLNSLIAVDEYLIAHPTGKTERGRDGVQLNQRFRFSEIANSGFKMLGFTIESRLLVGNFAVRRSHSGIPRAELIGTASPRLIPEPA